MTDNPLRDISGRFAKGNSVFWKGKKIESTTGKKHHNWKGGKPKCLVCGVLLSRKDATHCHKHSLFTEDRLAKIRSGAKKRTGSNHGRWIEDRSKLAKRQIRNDSAYFEWRKSVWLRDDFNCKLANPDCAGKIEAHHILGWKSNPELRYKLTNGITLCHAHHTRKRKDEAEMIPIFQKIVSEMQ